MTRASEQLIAALEKENARLTELCNSLKNIIVTEGDRMRAENARLHGLLQNSEMTVAEVIDANARLRELLRGVVREADRETNAFIAARAELGQQTR
jgi:predicted transcriptional regulator